MKKTIVDPSMLRFSKQNFLLVILLSIFHPCLSSLSLLPPTNVVVKYVNETYLVTCQSDNVNHTSKIFWTKGKQDKIGEKGVTHVSTYGASKALLFEKISSKDSGDYACHAPNEVVAFKLIVTSPVRFIDTPSIQTVQEHRSGVIKCKVKGDPKPTVLWKFEGKDLPDHRFKIIEDGLKILNVSLDDRGIYACKAFQVSQDASMKVENNIRLNIQHKPLHKKPVHAKVNQAYGFIGGIVNLTCEAVAEPAANFTWYRQHKKTMPGRIIEQPHWSVLQLYIQNASIFGDYLCKASNSLGTLDQIITLQEGVKPPPPRVMSLRAAGSDTLVLVIIGPDMNTTRKEFTNLMLPIGFRVEYKLKDDKNTKSKKDKQKIEGITEGWEDANVVEFLDGIDEDDQYPYILTNLIHNKIYEVRVATKNIAGTSEFIGPMEYRTLRLQADSVTSGTSAVIVTWSSVIWNVLLMTCSILKTL